jgi:hypothetical protein
VRQAGGSDFEVPAGRGLVHCEGWPVAISNSTPPGSRKWIELKYWRSFCLALHCLHRTDGEAFLAAGVIASRG